MGNKLILIDYNYNKVLVQKQIYKSKLRKIFGFGS